MLGLIKKDLYLISGFKFGCDFLAYKEDPNREYYLFNHGWLFCGICENGYLIYFAILLSFNIFVNF